MSTTDLEKFKARLEAAEKVIDALRVFQPEENQVLLSGIQFGKSVKKRLWKALAEYDEVSRGQGM